MSKSFEYAAGRDGAHAYQVCKLLGGNAADVKHIPFDLADEYEAQGYFNCGDGTQASYIPDGYYLPEPADKSSVAAAITAAAPQQVQGFVASPTPIATVSVTPAATKVTHLPKVGSGDTALYIALAGGILFGLVHVFLTKPRK